MLPWSNSERIRRITDVTVCSHHAQRILRGLSQDFMWYRSNYVIHNVLCTAVMLILVAIDIDFDAGISIKGGKRDSFSNTSLSRPAGCYVLRSPWRVCQSTPSYVTLSDPNQP